jgi:lysophospholipase L1-like esterase
MIDTLIRILLSPVLIAQALGVRKRAQLLPEAAGERSGHPGQGTPLRLQIIGDSSAAGVGAGTQERALAGQLARHLSAHCDVDWDLHARTGETTASTLRSLRNEIPAKKDVVLIVLGVNDVTRLVPAWLWVRQQRNLIARVRELYQPEHIFLTAMPPFEELALLPQPLRWTLASHAQKLSAARAEALLGITDVSITRLEIAPAPDLLASDGFHPSETLYALWGESLARQILESTRL